MANNYKLLCTDKHSDNPRAWRWVYYFHTLEEAQRAKKSIEKGGNKAKIEEV